MADKIVQLVDKDGNNIFPTVGENVPNMTLTDVDPGEGAALAAGNYIAVYGGAGSLLDLFYPVGCYFETSDANFNPNTAWGGIWIEDSAGKTTVALQSDNANFNSVGKVGGSVANDFSNKIHYAEGGFGAQQGSSAYSDRFIVGVSGKSGSAEQAYHPFNSLNNLQPYIVVKRWHRTA